MRFFRNPPRPRPETGNGDAGGRETRAEKPRGALRAREVFEAKRDEPERVSVPRECAVGDSANTPFSSATFRERRSIVDGTESEKHPFVAFSS